MKERFDVILKEVTCYTKPQTCKCPKCGMRLLAMKTALKTCKLSIKECKDLFNNLPSVIKKSISKKEAENIQEAFENIAVIEIIQKSCS